MGNIFTSPTADKIAKGHDLNGKVAVITGAANGIGYETTRALAKRGATVVLTCRELSQGERAKRNILEQIGDRFAEKICVFELDLGSLVSVKNFVEEFRKLNLNVHYLVLNAAVLGVPYRLTREGFEMHFGVNYLGHFYLTQLMLPILQKEQNEDVRIVAVCCTPPRRTKLKLKLVAVGKKQDYNAYKAYDQSKLALRYFAEEISLRLKETSISVVGVDPGVTYSGISRNLNPIVQSFMAFASIFMKTPPQGAATVVFACLDRHVPLKSKPFCSNCRLLKFNTMRCRNPNLRKELFERSQELIRGAVFDSCKIPAFNPTNEIWESMSRSIQGLMKRSRNKLPKRRFIHGSAPKYQKLE